MNKSVQSAKVNEIFAYFTELFGANPRCELNYTTDLELLIAIILSAQCTDKRVNMVTSELFARYKTAADYAAAPRKDLEALIKSTGFYRNKAANIQKTCEVIARCWGGRVPSDLDELVTLPGVGRKTANVFLSEYYQTPAIGVDTHVTRIANRLGFTASQNPILIERDLSALFARGNWAHYHLYLVLFGRYRCKALKPDCGNCQIRRFCKYDKKN